MLSCMDEFLLNRFCSKRVNLTYSGFPRKRESGRLVPQLIVQIQRNDVINDLWVNKMNSFTRSFQSNERRSGFDRRSGKICILSKYCLTGRRVIARREEDRQRSCKIDRHSAVTLAVILTIIMLSVLDAIFTLKLLDHGAKEINPIMAYSLNYNPLIFFGVKYLLTSISIIIVLLNKNVFLFNTKIKADLLLYLFIITFAFVIQWELYLIINADIFFDFWRNVLICEVLILVTTLLRGNAYLYFFIISETNRTINSIIQSPARMIL